MAGIAQPSVTPPQAIDADATAHGASRQPGSYPVAPRQTVGADATTLGTTRQPGSVPDMSQQPNGSTATHEAAQLHSLRQPGSFAAVNHQSNEATTTHGGAQIQSSFAGGPRQVAPGGMHAMPAGDDEIDHGSGGEERNEYEHEHEQHDEEDEAETRRRNSLVMSVRHVPAGGDDGSNTSGGNLVVQPIQGQPCSSATAFENADGFGDNSGSGSWRSASSLL